MRKPIVAGNWKMNKTVAEARELISGLLPGLNKINNVELIICPPVTDLWIAKEMLQETGIGLGAQNMYWELDGAFTGEVSPLMLTEVCEYVILGHSERRQFFDETDEKVNRKLKAALKFGLKPIVCIGETLDENQASLTADVVNRQVRRGLAGLNPDAGRQLIIAYEPIWAIGTGLAATPDEANAIHRGVVRVALADLFGESTAQSIRILYGGSVKPDNAVGFFSKSDIDGALVGGASLKANSFVAIAVAAS